MADCDFAVIGAGPAGSSAARHLAERGASVLLFERQRMPRPKPCGGALSNQSLQHIGLDLPNSVIHQQLYGVRVHFRGELAQGRARRPAGVLVDRAALDHFLVMKAEERGARAVWSEVKAVSVRSDGVVLSSGERDYTAPCAIICEGARARLSRHVRPQRDDWTCLCVVAEIPVRNVDPQAQPDGLLDIYFGVAPLGYGWVFHHGAYYSAGIVGLQSRLRSPRAAFEQFVGSRGLSVSEAKVKGHLLPWGGPRRPLCADRLLLAGDAAGVADPFTCEGVGYAARSGQLAAEAALAAAEKGDFRRADLEHYEELWEQQCNRNLRCSLRLTKLAHRSPTVVRAMLSSDEALRQFLLAATGEISYRRYLVWLARHLPAYCLGRLFGRRRSITAS